MHFLWHGYLQNLETKAISPRYLNHRQDDITSLSTINPLSALIEINKNKIGFYFHFEYKISPQIIFTADKSSFVGTFRDPLHRQAEVMEHSHEERLQRPFDLK